MRPGGDHHKRFRSSVVIGVRANPKPDDRAPLAKADGAPVNTDSHGVDRLAPMHSFELHAGMSWVRPPKQVALARSLANRAGEIRKQAAKRGSDM